MRLNAPFERLHPQYVFGQFLHEGSLAFKDGDPDFEAFKRVSTAVPTIVTVYLDRPAILTPIKEGARALLANFGVSDAALIDVLTGRARPGGQSRRRDRPGARSRRRFDAGQGRTRRAAQGDVYVLRAGVCEARRLEAQHADPAVWPQAVLDGRRDVHHGWRLGRSLLAGSE